MRQRIIASLLAVSLLSFFAVLLVGVTDARAADNVLVVTQDESSMERVIEGNLTTVHKLTVNEKFATTDDLYLVLPMTGDPMPAYHINIDTQAANREDATHQIIERAILVQLCTSVKVAPEHRAAVLEVLNDLNRKKIFSAAYIDTDGEIIIGWNLNVMADGLPIEYVYDVVARLDKLWKSNYADVAKALMLL